MTGRLIGTPMSPFVSRILVQIRAKGLEMEVSMPEDGIGSDSHKKLNPLGKIPTYVEGDLGFPESTVIAEYLEDTYPANPLRPSIAAETAQMNTIIRVHDLYVAEPFMGIFVQNYPGPANEEIVAYLTANLNTGLSHLDQMITPGPFACGGQFSLADCAVGAMLSFMSILAPILGVQLTLTDYPNISAYWAAIQKNEHVASVVADMQADVNAFAEAMAAQ